MEVQETAVLSNKIITIPNVLSFLRLLGIPVFVWLILAEHAYGWAFILLTVSSITDYLDGYLARSRNEITTFGKFMDPIADKLLVMAAMLVLVQLGTLPAGSRSSWWPS